MALIKCPECGADVSDQAEQCPKCAYPLKKKAAPVPEKQAEKKGSGCGTGCLIVFLLFILGLFLVMVSPKPKSASPGKTVSSQKQKETLTLLPGWKFDHGSYNTEIITGKVKNNTSKRYGYVQIQFNLYNSKNEQIGSTVSNVNNLEPNGVWRFEAPVMEEEATSAKLQDITGF